MPRKLHFLIALQVALLISSSGWFATSLESSEPPAVFEKQSVFRTETLDFAADQQTRGTSKNMGAKSITGSKRNLKNSLPNKSKSLLEDTTGFRVYKPSLIPTAKPIEELEEDLAIILDSPDLTNAHIGISILDIGRNKEVFRYNELKNFVPASVNKLLVTGAALEILGKNYTYQNDLYLSGDITLGGRFIGDIIIKGSGDPTLSNRFYDDPTGLFDDWIQQIKLLGITSFQGNIIGDDSFFDDDYYAVGWDYMDLKEPFAAQVNGLSIFENKIKVNIIPQDSIGIKPDYTLEPENDYVEIHNYINTVSPEDKSSISIATQPNSNIIELYGDIYTEDRTDIKKLQVTVDNPTLFFLELFRNRLIEFAIDTEGELLDIDELEQEIDLSSATKIEGWRSKPVHEIIQNVNKMSNNLVAESLLKTIARQETGVGSFANGVDVLSDYLVSKGINPSMILLKDGSGLSRNNLISPFAITRYLTSMFNSGVRDEYMASLAEPGKMGTLWNRYRGIEDTPELKAKTGSMGNVSTLAGYIKAKNGKDYAFCIMMNNFTVPISIIRNIQDLIVMRLSTYEAVD